MPIVRVAIPVPLPQLFDYLAEDATSADIGRRVRVPFGRGEKSGLILALPETAGIDPARLKPVIHIPRDAPPLPPDWLELVEFAARYYPAPPTLLHLITTAPAHCRPLPPIRQTYWQPAVLPPLALLHGCLRESRAAARPKSICVWLPTYWPPEGRC
jgi:primosomal protein N'